MDDADVAGVEPASANVRAVSAASARQGFPHVTAGVVKVVENELRAVPADGRTLGEVVVRGYT